MIESEAASVRRGVGEGEGEHTVELNMFQQILNEGDKRFSRKILCVYNKSCDYTIYTNRGAYLLCDMERI